MCPYFIPFLPPSFFFFWFGYDGPQSGFCLISLVLNFRVTVVEKYKIYWVKIPGPIISQPNALPFTTPEATRAPLSTFPPVSHLTKSVSNIFMVSPNAICNNGVFGNCGSRLGEVCREVAVLGHGSKFLGFLQEIWRKSSLQHYDLQVRIKAVQDPACSSCGSDIHTESVQLNIKRGRGRLKLGLNLDRIWRRILKWWCNS